VRVANKLKSDNLKIEGLKVRRFEGLSRRGEEEKRRRGEGAKV